jgi:hypothetical protein
MRRVVAVALAAIIGQAAGCNAEVEVGSDLGAAMGAGGEGGSAGMAGAPSCMVTSCGSMRWHCGNCVDDDGDGLIDAEDPDCIGACDDTEGSFDTGIAPPASGSCALDCYFDMDNGVGNDGCAWSHRCDPLSLAPDYPPSGASQCEYTAESACDDMLSEQTAQCMDTCLPLTPNGCDCFGCCELPAGSGSYVWLGSTMAGMGSCTRDTLDDPSRCKPCTQVSACLNPCDRCELCAGKTELPADCAEGMEPQCAPFLQPCGGTTGQSCPVNFYCITGCCVAVPT